MAFGLTPAGTLTKEQTRLSIRRLPVTSNANIAKGDVCFVNTSGYLDQATSSTSAGSEWYVALEPANNTGGISAAISCPVAVRGHYVTVVADGTIQAGTPVKLTTTAGRVIVFVTGTDAEGLKVGVYTGKEGGKIAKSTNTPYAETYTDNADFTPVACAQNDVIEVRLI
jgi:hypothetical protein